MSISRRLRFEILRRDDYTCRYCGASAPEVELAVDHVIPITLGGGDEPTNLVTACVDCNAGKSSVHPDSRVVDEVDAFAMLFVRAVEKAAEIRKEELGDIYRAIVAFDDNWLGWTYGAKTLPIPRDNDWRASVERFLTHGLALEELLLFSDQAMGAKCPPEATWRYFCKRAWNEIRSRQEMARQLIEDGKV